MTGITITREGRRTWITGDTWAFKNEIKAAKAHWDTGRKAWWIGDHAVAEDLATKINLKANASHNEVSTALNGITAMKSRFVLIDKTTDKIVIRVPYSLELNAICKSVPGRFFDRERKIFLYSTQSAPQILAAIPAIEAATVKHNQQQQAEKETRATRLEAERDERAAARIAAKPARYTCLYHSAPAVGATLRLKWLTAPVTVTGMGTSFRLADDDEDFLGNEGEKACYVYYRNATPEEMAELEANEVTEARERLAAQDYASRYHHMVKLFEASKKCQTQSISISGEILIEDTKYRAYGGGEAWIIDTVNRRLWHIERRFADGDDWQVNQVDAQGYGSGMGTYAELTPELELAARNATVQTNTATASMCQFDEIVKQTGLVDQAEKPVISAHPARFSNQF